MSIRLWSSFRTVVFPCLLSFSASFARERRYASSVSWSLSSLFSKVLISMITTSGLPLLTTKSGFPVFLILVTKGR